MGLIPMGLFFGAADALWAEPSVFHALFPRVAGAFTGFVILAAVLVVSTVVMRKTGRLDDDQTAMGWGDPCLLAGIGAFVGFLPIPLVLFLASAQGAVAGIVLMMTGQLGERKPVEGDEWVPPPTGVPFGPFLALAALEVAFWWSDIPVGEHGRILQELWTIIS